MKRKGVLVILADILVFGVVLVGFAWLHHGRPQTYDPIKSIIEATASPEVEITVAPVTQSPAVADSTPEPTPEPTPVVYAKGDFTLTFPTQDTGEGALYSYQSDDARIAVNMVQEDGVTYFVSDVWVRNIELVRAAFAKGQFGTGISDSVINMAEENGAYVAVSGDFCGAHNSGVVIRNGVLYRETNGTKEVCVIYYDGTMQTYTADEFSLEDAVANGAWQAWSFGPRLMEDGHALTEIKSKIGRANPRCAIGYYEPGHYCLVLVDGRQSGYSAGMTLDQLAALMEKLGCVSAYNLDGGATAMMYYDGEGIISSPSGGGRYSSDIIYIGKGE